MDGQSSTETLQLCPQRIIVRMREVVALDKHRANERASEARHLSGTTQLFNRMVHVLNRNHRRREESVGRRLTEIGDPVVISTRQSIRDVGIFDEMESF